MNVKCFEFAKEESYRSTYDGSSHIKIGCVVMYHGTIIAKGHNTNTTHPWQARQNKKRYLEPANGHYYPPKVHSELNALLSIRWRKIDWSKVELYIYREINGGQLAMRARALDVLML